MAKAETTEKPESVEAPAPVQTITLDEFCTRLSEKVRSPELIGGFHQTRRAAGVLVDTEASFRASFDEFINAPV